VGRAVMRLVVGVCIDRRYVLKVNGKHALHHRGSIGDRGGGSRDGNAVARDERREEKGGSGWI
jgi:hypothetical protein